MTFYEHIIPAITSSTQRESILNVLQAVEHGGSPPNMPEIVNGFELLLMVLFFDSEVVEDIWSSNQIQRESTL